LTVSTACAAGTNAIGIARDMIVFEGYDAVICGGADTLDRMKYLGHSALNTLTPTVIQPFGAERDGTIFGEGAGLRGPSRAAADDHRERKVVFRRSGQGRDGRLPGPLGTGVSAPRPVGPAALEWS